MRSRLYTTPRKELQMETATTLAMRSVAHNLYYRFGRSAVADDEFFAYARKLASVCGLDPNGPEVNEAIRTYRLMYGGGRVDD